MQKINSTGLVIWLVIIGFGLFIYYRQCHPGLVRINKTDSITIRDTVEIHDTTTLENPVPYKVFVKGDEVPIEITDTQYLVTVNNMPIDSEAIIIDYFKERRYVDTVRSKYGFAIVRAIVKQNKLRWFSSVNHYVIFDSVRAAANTFHNQVYLNLNVGSNGESMLYGAGLMLKTKQDQMYRVGIDFIPALDKPFMYSVGSAWKIHF